MNSRSPLIPKDPDVLRAALIGRISTEHQDEANIAASFAYDRRHLGELYAGEVEFSEYGERGSGLLVDREMINAARAAIATRRFDVVVMEDLSRAHRNTAELLRFIQFCVDHDTRVIAPADNFDTADENWENMALFATVRHSMHVPDVRRRVKRTASHAFKHGGMVQKVKFGYRRLKEEEANSGAIGPKGLRIAKDPNATDIIRKMAASVIAGSSYRAVAEWLNDEQIAPGLYVKGGWTDRLVQSLLADPILIGTRQFRKSVSRPIYSTGGYIREKNPDEPESSLHPELAHLTPEEWQALQQAMAERSARSKAPRGRKNSRYRLSRSRAVFPFQHATCGICGELMYAYQGDQMKCCNSRRGAGQRCWNHVQVDVNLARDRIIEWYCDILESRPALRERAIDAAWDEYRRRQRREERSATSSADQLKDIDRQLANVTEAIAVSGGSETLMSKLRELEERRRELTQAMIAQQAASAAPSGFRSREDVATRLHAAIRGLASTSHEFGDFMRRILPRFQIAPVHRFDQDFVRPRARLTLCPLPDGHADGQEQGETIEVELDLFEPPLEVRHMEACRTLKAEQPEMTLREIGDKLGFNHNSVKRALRLAHEMQERNLTSPYIELTAKPVAASRWKWRIA